MGNSGSKKKINKKDTPKSKDDSAKSKDLKEYTMEEISKHDSRENGVWIVINNLVYDVTEFLDQHPGGAMFLIGVGGEDGTSDYIAIGHTPAAMERANAEFLIGKLKKESK